MTSAAGISAVEPHVSKQHVSLLVVEPSGHLAGAGPNGVPVQCCLLGHLPGRGSGDGRHRGGRGAAGGVVAAERGVDDLLAAARGHLGDARSGDDQRQGRRAERIGLERVAGNLLQQGRARRCGLNTRGVRRTLGTVMAHGYSPVRG